MFQPTHPIWILLYWFRPGTLFLAMSLLVFSLYCQHLRQKYSDPRIGRRFIDFYLRDRTRPDINRSL